MDRYSIVNVVAPADEPVTLAQAKAHLGVTHSNDDTFISALITAAREACENELNRALVYSQWALRLDAFPCEEIIVPKPPLYSVASIAYIDGNGAEQTWAAASYQVDAKSEPGRIMPAFGGTWPQTREQYNAVIVTYWAGYAPVEVGSPTDFSGNVPQAIKQAILLTLGNFYGNRESVIAGPAAQFVQLPQNAKWLLGQHRVEDFRLSS